MKFTNLVVESILLVSSVLICRVEYHGRVVMNSYRPFVTAYLSVNDFVSCNETGDKVYECALKSKK